MVDHDALHRPPLDFPGDHPLGRGRRGWLRLKTTANTAGGGGSGGTLYVEIGAAGGMFKLDRDRREREARHRRIAGEAPDGKLILLADSAIVETDETFAQHRKIIQFDSDPELSNNGFHDPQVSPDGTRIAYTSNDDHMFVVDRADGTVVARFS